jgi:CPA1 family monovalent cation:H+ antiporter
MQQTSQVANLVGGVITLLLIATVVLAVTKRWKLPFTIVLVLVGIGLSALSAAYPHVLPTLHDLEISSALIFYVFLPTLIFEAAFNLDVRQLRENLGAVLVLAVPGLLLSTLIIGLMVGMATPIPFPAALLLGAILSATDPVAVVAVFRRLGAPQKLSVLVEGESLFNDATSIVLAHILLGVVLAGTLSDVVIVKGAIDFVVVFVGGLVVGWLLGLLTGYTLGKVEDHFIEITLTTVLAYVSYLVAEEALHVSGVMATIAAGLTIGGWGRMKVSYAVRDYLEHFWTYVAFIANALIFLMVGLRVDLGALWATLGLLGWVVVALLVSRAAVIYGLMPCMQRLSRAEPINSAYQAVIFWGGLRGAIALAIALSLPSFEHGEMFVALVMGAVLFTLLVEGLSIEPLVRWLGLDRPLLADRLARLESDFTAKQHAMDHLPELLASGLFSGAVAMRLQMQYEKQLDGIKAAIEALHSTELGDDDTQRALLSLRALAEEKSLHVDMFEKGHLSERAFRQLLLTLQLQLDAVRNRGAYQKVPAHRSSRHRLDDVALRLLNKVAALAPLAERLHLQHIVLDYEMARARLQSSRRVLDVLDTLARVEATPSYVVAILRHQYQQQYETAQHALDQIAEQFPEFLSDMQERLARRLLLVAEAETIVQQAEHGTLPAPVAERMEEDVSYELRSLQGHDVAKLKLEPIELVRRMPGFQDIPLEDLANIAVRMHLQVVPERHIIIRQGEVGDYMYFIAHGVVRVSRAEHGVSRDLATMMAGEFFGEVALLHDRQPRNATVTAVTPCTLYRLHRDDLRVVMATQPAIRKALEEESRKRIAMHYAG